jgi:hypothetical protein
MHRMWRSSAFLMLLLCAGAEQPQGDRIDWHPDAPGCEVIREGGIESKAIRHGDIGLRVYLHSRLSHIEAGIRIVNGGKSLLEIDPRSISLEVLDPERKTLHVLDANALAGSIEANALEQFRKKTAERDIVSGHKARSSNRPAVLRRWMPQSATELDNPAQAELREQRVLAALVRNNALPPSKIEPGANLTGYAYFQSQPFTRATLSVTVGGQQFAFPFTRE